jgi:hypothetical protein
MDNTLNSKARRHWENHIEILKNCEFDLEKYYTPILILVPKEGYLLKTRTFNGKDAADRLLPKFKFSIQSYILHEFEDLRETILEADAEYIQLAKAHLKNNGTSTKNSEGAAD